MLCIALMMPIREAPSIVDASGRGSAVKMESQKILVTNAEHSLSPR